MKKLTLIVSIVAIVLSNGITNKAAAQYYFYDNNYYDNPVTFELGASGGIMNCLTDLAGRKGIGKKFVKDLNLGNTQPTGGFYIAANYKYAVTLRAEAAFGMVKSADEILKPVKETVYGRYERNLSFRSTITEFSVVAEFHPLYIFFKYDDEHDREPPRFSPYLLAGVGFFSFNPQAQLNGKWIDLQPLSTEGQGFKEYPDRQPYKLNQVNIPVGFGIKYELGTNFNVRGEFVYRILNTDYLDDVSTTYIDPTLYANYFTGQKLTNALLLNNRQAELDPTHVTQTGDQRGNPKNNDSYFSFNLKIGYIIGRERIRR